MLSCSYGKEMNKSKKRAASAAYCFCDALVVVDVVGSTFVDASFKESSGKTVWEGLIKY